MNSRCAPKPKRLGRNSKSPCYVNLQEKKKTLPLSGTSHRLLDFSLCMDPSIRTPHQRSQASRLNHLLFEVVAVAPPQVAYSFVTKNLPTLHTFDRAGHVAGTRRATKSQLSRCSCLSENASIRAERFHNPFYPRAAWGLWRSGGTACEAARCAPGFQAPTRRASGVLGPTHRSPRHMWSPGENRHAFDR